VDLNSAALDQLQTLPGITRDYATRIVAGRPYRVFSDAVTRAGIPAAIVNELRPPRPFGESSVPILSVVTSRTGH
jgi:DNA uptake protein ComE-like DNA-binding protein